MSGPLSLHELQECLLGLKELYPQLKLKKGPSKPAAQHGACSDSSKGPADPFPISLSVSITPPLSASRYDVEPLGVAILLQSSILQKPPPADAVSTKVTNPELPHKLKSTIAQQLHDVWAAAAAGRSGGGAMHGSQTDPLGLHAVLRHAEQQFVPLITSCPQFIEAYEGVDSNGATQRRYAVVDTADADGAEAVASAEASPAQMPAEAARAGAAGALKAAAAGARDAHLNAPASSSSSSSRGSRGSAAIPLPPEEPTAGSHSVGSPAAASSPTQPQGKPADSSGAAAAAAAAVTVGATATDHHHHQQQQQDRGSQCESRGGTLGEPTAALRSSSTHTHPAEPPVQVTAQQQERQQQQQQERQQRQHQQEPQQRQHQQEPQQRQHQQQQWQQRWQQQQQVGYTGHVTSAGAAGAEQGSTAHTQGAEGRHAAAAAAAAAPSPSPSPSPSPPTEPLQGTQQHAAALPPPPQQQQQLQAPGRGRGRGRGLGRGTGRFSEGFGRGLYPGRDGAGPTTAFVGGRAGGGGGGGVPEVQCAGHELAARDLQAAQRRYGRSFRLQQQEQHQQHQQQQQAQGGLLLQAGAAAGTDQLQDYQQQQFVGNPASPAATPSALQQQQQQQQQQAPPVVQQQQFQQQQPQPPQSFSISFSIMLRPTDPLWGAARGPLHVTGTLNPALYPAAHSLSLTLNPGRGVAAAETWVLQETLEGELQQQAGRPWQLRTVLRWLENYAGSELDRCYQAQQQLFAQDSHQPQQQQQQQQRQQQQQQSAAAARQAGRAGGVPRHRQSTQYRAAGASSTAHPAAAHPAAAAAAAAAAGRGAAAAGVAQAQDRPGSSQGGIRILRATKAPAGQQRQQQQQLGVDADLKPLLRGDAAANSWLSAPAAAAADNRGDTSDGGSSDSNSSSSDSSRMGPGNSRQGDKLHDGRSSSDNTNSCSGSSNGSSDSEDGSAYSSEGERDEVQLHGGGVTGSDGPGGWAVSLEGLRLDNVGVVEVVRASLQVSCTRCSSTATLLLTAEGSSRISSATAATATPDAASASLAAAAGSSTGSSGSSARAFEWVGSCSTCQQGQSVLLRPRFVHEGSNILAGLKAVGCSPLDLLPSVYGATCGDCDAVGALRALQVGVPANRTCGHCHRAMGVSIRSVAFIPQGPPSGVRGRTRHADGGPSRRSRAAGGGGRAGGALVEGTPLPDNGACKHYRHSYRWLRFPCCGARYPCDLCHEEATPDGHDAAWATRMVCC